MKTRELLLFFILFIPLHLFADYTESHSGAIGEKINLRLRPETDTMFPKLLESSPDWDVGKGNPIGYKAISFSSKQSEASVRINSYFSGVVRIICTYDIYNPQKGSSYFARKHAIFEISCSSPNPNPDIAPDDPSPNVQPGDVGSYFQEDTQEGTSLLFRVVNSGVAKEICAYVVKPAGNAGANVQHQKATLTVPSRVRGLNVRGIDSYGLGALEKVETIILPNTIVDYCSRGITVLNNNKLSTIVLQSETPPNAYGNDSFQSELYSKVKLLVPSQRAVENYKSALVWKKFENIGVVDEPAPIELISILFPNYTETMNVGGRLTLEPIITPYNAETKLKWESSNTKVATVSQSGDVEGIKEGESKITVTSSNGKSAYCYVKVIATPKPQLSLSASPTSGEVEKGTIVKLTAKANGSIVSADIYYTLNGDNPTKSSTKYTSSGITINSDCTLKAIAYKDGYETSAVIMEKYKVKATPKPQLTLSANPASGEVEKGTTVKLTAKANGPTVSADIYYTLNGATPSKSSTPYTSAGITINSDCTLKAIAYKDGYETSSVLTANYKVIEVQTTPKIEFVSVTCDNTNLSSLTNNDKLTFHAKFKNSGATGKVKTAVRICNSNMNFLYSGVVDEREFKANETTTVDYAFDLKDIPVGSYKATVMYYSLDNEDGKYYWWYYDEYVKDIKVVAAKPQLSLSASPASGEVEKGTVVKLTAKANGSTVSADIYYTLNGTTPTNSSTKYTSAGITINSDCTLKAIAYKDGYETSAVITEKYNVKNKTVELTVYNSIIDGELAQEFATVAGVSGGKANNNVDGKSIIVIKKGNATVTAVGGTTPANDNEIGGAAQQIIPGAAVAGKENTYKVKSVREWNDIKWERKAQGDIDFWYITGTGNPYVNMYAVQNTKDGKLIPDSYKAEYQYYEPDGSVGMPVTGLYYKFMSTVRGSFKVKVWSNKGNRKTFVVNSKNMKAQRLYASGYINGVNDEYGNKKLLSIEQVDSVHHVYIYGDYEKAVQTGGKTKRELADMKEEADKMAVERQFVIGNGNQNFWGWLTFDVEAGEEYWVFQHSSQIGFGGFEFYEGESMGINSFVMDKVTKNNSIYSLSGQRLDAPRKGINIINGKKVVIK